MKILPTILVLGLLISPVGMNAATCTGADPCKACKNCSSCKHCKKDGGSCGACATKKPKPAK